jgi:predicted SnoaL-like aldol condensation-catalyzing enzyme
MSKCLVFLLISACAPLSAQVPVSVATDQAALLKDPNPRLAANKQVAFDFWRTVLDAGHADQAGKYLDENYIQHNPVIPTGRAAIVGMLSKATPKPIQPTVAGLVNVVADGDTVILAFVDEEPDPRKPGAKYTTTRFDMFRIQNGKIMEHWDNMRIGAGPPGGPGAPPGPPPG